MNTRRPLDAKATALMVGLCFCFGMQQVALKASAQDMAPVLQIAQTWKAGLAVGVLFFLEYLFLGQALHYTSASRSVVFLYTAPIFTALILHFLEVSERMAPLQWGGILLAFGGIGTAFFGHQAGSGQGLASHGWVMRWPCWPEPSGG